MVDIGTRVVSSFLLLIFLLVIFQLFADVQFLEILGMNFNTQRSAVFFINFMRPLFLLGILIFWAFMAFGAGPVPSFLIGIFGFAAYVLLTSDVFFMMLNLPAEKEISIRVMLNYLSPAIVSGIMIAVIAIMIKFKKI